MNIDYDGADVNSELYILVFSKDKERDIIVAQCCGYSSVLPQISE